MRVSSRPAASTPDGSAIVRSRDLDERQLRIFRVTQRNGPRAYLVRLKDLWQRVGFGGSQAMNFTPSNEDELEVRFLPGSLSYSVRSATEASFDVELEEVR